MSDVLGIHFPMLFSTLIKLEFLVMTQTGISVIAMLSVDRCHRPNALAFLMLTSHLLGDVPLPIVIGLIKDKMAPACRVGPSGEFVNPEQCREQQSGVRKSLAIAYSWVLLSLIFFEIARQFALRNSRQEIGTVRSEDHDNNLLSHGRKVGREKGGFAYSHFRFQPRRTKVAKGDDASILNESYHEQSMERAGYGA